MPSKTGTDMGVQASYSPDGKKLAYNPKSQSYWRKYYRGALQSDVVVMDIAAKRSTQLTDFDGHDSWPMWAVNNNNKTLEWVKGHGIFRAP